MSIRHSRHIESLARFQKRVRAKKGSIMVNFEKAIIVNYLSNLLASHGHKTPLLLEICEYLESNRTLLAEKQAVLEKFMDEEEINARVKDPSRPGLKKLRKLLQELLDTRHAALAGDTPSTLENNLRLLGEHLELTCEEQAFLGLVMRHRCHQIFSGFLNEISRNHINTLEAAAILTGIEMDLLIDALRPQGHLLSSGVLQKPGRPGTDLDDHFQLPDQVYNAIYRNNGDLSDMLSSILGTPATTTLEWADFVHLGPVRDRLATLLKRVGTEHTTGVNILIWGEPGTGKTEFCKSLAAQLGLRLYPAGETDDEGGAPSRQERLNYYRLAQSLLRFSHDTLLLFDEMDDLFEGSALARLFGGKVTAPSKVFMNRLLENNPVPALWLINTPSMLDEAFLRRMSLVVEVKVPPPSQRQRVWSRLLERNQIDLPQDDVKELAALNLSPALIDSAARYTRQVDGSAEDFRFAAQGILHLVRGKRPQPKNEVLPFLPELTRADIDLQQLTERLVSSPNRAFSLCLYGPPGTGKSAYARFLAEQLEMPVLFKRASDLLDKYVGESEKQIADAFQQAIDQEAFLIFDEADSLLGDRRHAVRSWEITQVNEMLTWMECHPLPFACTTNLMGRLDQASLRRFTFKSCFDYLHPEQIAAAFRYFFALDPPSCCQDLSHLTPGDFAVVRKKARVLELHHDPQALLHLLHEEATQKHDARINKIGFA